MANQYKLKIIPATIADYPTIQNMARFYVYDRSSYMGWSCEDDGSFSCIDFKHYFETPEKEPYLVTVDRELAGFVLLDKEYLLDKADWNMGEFFIFAKFQGTGVAQEVAKEIFRTHPGSWSVAIMLENIKAVKFWHKIIKEISGGSFTKTFKKAENKDEYNMEIYQFDTFNID